MRARRHAGTILAVAIALAVLAAPALGQTFVTPREIELHTGPDETGQATVTVRNPVNQALFANAQLSGAVDDDLVLDKQQFNVPAAGTATLNLTTVENAIPGSRTGDLELTLVNRDTGETQVHTVPVHVTIEPKPLLFGEWDNPLPSPLDGVMGLVALELVTWLTVAFLAIRINDQVLKAGMKHGSERFRNQLLERVDGPLFGVLLLGGLLYTARFVRDFPWLGWLDQTLTAFLAIAIAFLIYRVLDSGLSYYGRHVAPETASRWDDVAVPVLRKVSIAVLFGMGAFYVMQWVGLDLSFLVAGGVVIGLVLSNSLGPTLANLFSGLFILMDRPFREGDDIRLDTGEVCRVDEVGLRSTRLYYYRNHEVIVAPNNQLEDSRIINLAYPDRRYRLHLEVGVAYGSDLAKVRQIMNDVAEEHPDVLASEGSEPEVFFDDFSDNALLFRLAFYITDVAERFRIYSELRNRIDKRFEDAGITIPFPQRTIWDGDRHEQDPLADPSQVEDAPEDPESGE